MRLDAVLSERVKLTAVVGRLQDGGQIIQAVLREEAETRERSRPAGGVQSRVAVVVH